MVITGLSGSENHRCFRHTSSCRGTAPLRGKPQQLGARQSSGRMSKPNDFISDSACHRHRTEGKLCRNLRSTVGTSTENYEYSVLAFYMPVWAKPTPLSTSGEEVKNNSSRTLNQRFLISRRNPLHGVDLIFLARHGRLQF